MSRAEWRRRSNTARQSASAVAVRIDVDSDGDGVFETSMDRAWEAIAG